MKKIEIYEHCFGPGVLIDDISLDMAYDYDGNPLDNEANEIKNEKIDDLIDKLKELKHSLDQRDLYAIAEMVATRGGYDYNEELSQDGKSCDQCGNYNYSYVYEKK